MEFLTLKWTLYFSEFLWDQTCHSYKSGCPVKSKFSLGGNAWGQMSVHGNKQGSRAAGKHQRNKKNYTENYILNIIEHINKKWTQKHWGTRTALDFLPNRRTTTTNSFYTISQYYSNQCITFMANNITNLMVTLLKKKPNRSRHRKSSQVELYCHSEWYNSAGVGQIWGWLV